MTGPITLIQPDRYALDGDGHAIEAGDRMVWVEWIGQPSPMRSPTVQRLMIGNKRLPLEKKQAIRFVAANVVVRVDGTTSRTLRSGNGVGQISGLSQDWTWGPGFTKKPNGRTIVWSATGEPGSYIQRMPYRDADLLKQSICGPEFRILGYAGDTDTEPITVATNEMLQDELFNAAEATRLGPAEPVVVYKQLARKMGWSSQ